MSRVTQTQVASFQNNNILKSNFNYIIKTIHKSQGWSPIKDTVLNNENYLHEFTYDCTIHFQEVELIICFYF